MTKIVQNFKTSSIKFNLSLVFNHTHIQQKKHKSYSLNHYSSEPFYLGFCHYLRSIIHFYYTLINFWKKSARHLKRERTQSFISITKFQTLQKESRPVLTFVTKICKFLRVISIETLWLALSCFNEYFATELKPCWWTYQTNYFVKSHYSSNRLQQSAVWTTTKTTIVL